MLRFGRRTHARGALLGLACTLIAFASPGRPAFAQGAAPSSGGTPQSAAAPQASTAAAVGLLPVHAIDVDLDALPGAGGKGGAKADDFAPLQQLWDSFLKGGGFNVIEFDVDVRDLGDRGAGRVARLCGWAKQNNVRIAPTLVGAAEGQPLPADYANLAASFVGKVIAQLGAAGVSGYSQVVFYQLDRPLNQPGNHGAMEPAAATALLKSAAESIRAAEQAGLASSGLEPTPLLVPGSFDYELIRRGAIAHTAISDESYNQAYEGLRDYLATVLGAAPVEAVAVQWFPGSLSSAGVDRLPDLVSRLESDLPGKLLIIDTGYSSAAGSDTAQARYYQVALNNLCDLRANQGVESAFAGILWRSAVDGANSEVSPVLQQPRADDVTKAWNDPKAGGKDARAWVTNVQSHFGLLSRAKTTGTGLAPKTAYRIMSGLESALSQSPEASDALAAAKELAAAGKTGTMGQAVKSRLQSAIFGMLDAWLTKSADNMFTSDEGPAPAPVQGGPPQLPDLQIYFIDPLPAKVATGTPVQLSVTLFNAGNAPASDATVYLSDGKPSDLTRTNPVSIPPGGQVSLQLAFTPRVAGVVPAITVDAFCSNDSDPSSNRYGLGDLLVEGGTKPPRPKGLDAMLGTLGSRTLMQSDASPSKNPPAPGNAPAGETKTMMVTQSSIGFAAIEGLSAPKVMMAKPTSTPTAPTTSARILTGSSSTSATAGAAATMSASAATPREPVTMTFANPFNTSFHNAVATLRIDNSVVSTRTLGTLLPGQRRTVTFVEWSPPHPGTFNLRADLEGTDRLGKRLTSSATSTITIGGPAPVTRMAPLPAGPARSMTGARTLTPFAHFASSQPVRGFGGGTRGLSGSPTVRSLNTVSPLTLSANSIILRPFPPSPGLPTAITVQLSNLARVVAHGARVAVSVDGEALGETTVDVPASGAALVSGFRDWIAKPGRHDVRATVVVGAARSEASRPLMVTAPGARWFGRPGAAGGAVVAGGGLAGGPKTGGLPGDRGSAVLQGGSGGGLVAQPGFKPMFGTPRTGLAADLQILPTDLRFTPPAPAAGAAMTITINVRNLAAAAATDGRVLAVLTAGGVEVARRQFTAAVAANGLVSLEWPLTAPTGVPLVVTATATATGDANAANNQARATAMGKLPVKGIAPRSVPGTIRKGVVTP